MLWYVLRSVVVFLLAWAVATLLRRRSASVRHLIWLAAFVAIVAMPAFGGIAAQIKVTPPPAVEPILRPLAPQLAASPDPQRSVTRVLAETIAPPTTPVSETKAPEATAIDPYALVAGAYWLGLILVVTRYLVAARVLRRAVRHSRLVETVAPGYPIRLVEAGYLASPATFGWPRAVVLLPEESQDWPEARRNATLAHEFAHIERADWVWQCVALGVCAAQWFNPLAWFAAARLRAEAEGAADDTVLRQGLAPSHYAQDLLEVAKGIRRDTALAVPVARPGGIASRIRAILSPHRDRRAATHPAHLAAGTGTLFTAAILGGLGLSAAVSSAPITPQDPFQIPERGGMGIGVHQPESLLILDDGEFGVQQVQVRPQGGKEVGWDSIGRSVYLQPTRIPRTPEVPGRKVREIAIACPPTRHLAAELPAGAEIIQIAREKRLAIVTVSFPANARVTSIKIGLPKAPGLLTRNLSPIPVAGPDGHALSPDLAWFALPRANEVRQYQLQNKDGIPIPIKGQFDRRKDESVYVAVDKVQADLVAKVQECLLVPDWQTFTPLLLDPAPKQIVRPNAPEPKIALPGGGTLSIIRIENQTPGEPIQSWAADGGAPGEDYDRNSRDFVTVDEKNFLAREVSLRLESPTLAKNQPSFNWIIEAPMKSRSSGFGYSPKQNVGRVSFEIPKDLKEAVLQAGYAYEPWRTIVDEPLGGPRLNATATVDANSTVNGLPTVKVEFDPPQSVAPMNLIAEAYDQQGKLLTYHSLSGPSYDHIAKTYDYHRTVHFDIQNPSQIARLVLKARPYHRITLPPIPMHPR